MEYAVAAYIMILTIIAVAFSQQSENKGRKISELTDRLENLNSYTLDLLEENESLRHRALAASEEARNLNETLSAYIKTNISSEPHYAVYVDGLLKFTFNDHYHVAPLSRFGKNVYVVRNGKPIKWIGKGKEMYHKNYCGSEMAAS